MKTSYLQAVIISLFISLVSCKKKVDQPAGNQNNNTGGTTPGIYSGTKLAVSTALNLASPIAELGADSVYTSYTISSGLFRLIPSGFEDKIISFYLPKGYMLVVAANEDGTGESACFIAIDSAIKANLPLRLRNNISYIRYMDIKNPEKKGTASVSDAEVQSLSNEWFYGWSINRSSFPNQQFAPMTWGKGSCTDANVVYLAERSDVDHLLSFNEPDNASQSNVPVDTAIQRYKVMLKSGLRLGSPAVTQDQAYGTGKWQTSFMTLVQNQKVRLDYVALHWYDWGNQTNNAATDSLTAEKVFNRFVTYIQNVRSAYPSLPIWVTEFNANINRTSEVVHKYFMKLSTEWMNNTPYVERYSYFFPSPLPPTNSTGTLTSAGAYWKSLPSAKSFSGNSIVDATLIK